LKKVQILGFKGYFVSVQFNTDRILFYFNRDFLVLGSRRVPPPRKRYNNILSNNFRKLKRIVVIFAEQHKRSKEKLTLERKSTSTN